MRSLFDKNTVSQPLFIFIGLLLSISSLVFGQYQSSILHFDGNGRLVYHSDQDGNRIPDFSHAGYKSGEVDLPEVPVALTIDPISGDNTAHIQAAIDQVSAMPLNANGHRGAVLLNPGYYPVYGTCYISASGVVLRGSGEGDDPANDTIIQGAGTTKRTLIVIGSNSGSNWSGEVSGSRVNITSEYIPAGSHTFEVENASHFSVGDNIIIRHPSTQAWIDAVNGGDTAADAPWNPGEIDMKFNRYITRIEGDKIVVKTPIHHELDRSLSQAYAYEYTKANQNTGNGIENLRVVIQTGGPTSEDHVENAISFSGVEDCWAKDVTTLHFIKAGIRFEEATNSTVLNCTALEPHSIIDGGRRYNFCLGSHCSNVLFKGCHASEARHAFVSNGTSTVSGIVFTGCSSVDEHTASEGHRRWGEAFLWDNTSFNSNNCQRVLGLYNRGDWGTGHGWTGTNQVAWNISAPNNQIVIQKPPIGQNYAIGCDATVDNNGPFNHPVGWIEGIGEDLVIDSLYETQLSERLTYGVGPDTPGKLKASDYSFTENPKYVTLEWMDIALDETNYILERSSDGGNTFVVVAVLSQNIESYTDTNILQDNYYYRLKAVNDIGASAYCNLLYVDLLDDGSTLFADGFEDCFSNWTNGGAYCSGVHYEGLQSCKMDNSESVETAVDTTGYSNVVLSYVRNTSGLNPGDSFVSEWYDGSSWNTIENITSGFSGWTEVSSELPATAGNNAAFMIRFRVSTVSGNYAYVDSVSIDGSNCAESADFNCDGIVDVDDLSYMAGVWLTDDSKADIAEPVDGIVNLLDFSVLSQDMFE